MNRSFLDTIIEAAPSVWLLVSPFLVVGLSIGLAAEMNESKWQRTLVEFCEVRNK